MPGTKWHFSFSASPCHPTHCRDTCRCTYVIVTRLHGRELPDNKFNCRLQVLINKVGGLSLRVAACLKSRGEGEVRSEKGHLYTSKHMPLGHFAFLLSFISSWSGMLDVWSSAGKHLVPTVRTGLSEGFWMWMSWHGDVPRPVGYSRHEDKTDTNLMQVTCAF